MKSYIYDLMTDRRQDVLSRLVQFFLWLLSVFFGWGVQGRTFLYRVGVLTSRVLPKPVISVGNLTLGGVGKTPLVISIVEFLRREGITPAILIRGYMDTSAASAAVESDEAVLLKESLPGVPVLVGPDRVANALSLSPQAADVFILDDGFQHWRIARQLDIVAVDATNPFGNKHLLPRGILREPLSALERAHFFVLTKSDVSQEYLENIGRALKVVNPHAPTVHARHRPVALIDMMQNDVLPLSFLEGKKVCAFCSIGDPHSFLNTLAATGAVVDKNFTFMDHHIYNRQDLEQVADHCRSHEVLVIVTTQKDAVKVKPQVESIFKGLQLVTLKIAMDFTKGQDVLFQKVLRVCREGVK